MFSRRTTRFIDRCHETANDYIWVYNQKMCLEAELDMHVPDDYQRYWKARCIDYTRCCTFLADARQRMLFIGAKFN